VRQVRAGLLAVAIAVVVAGCDRAPAAVPPSASAPPSPTSSPPPATGPITDQQFLQPEDLGAGYRVAPGGGSGDWTAEFSASLLECPPGGATPSPVDKHQRGLVRGSPEAGDTVIQYVARYRSGDAARYLDELATRVGSCRPAPGRSISVARHGFAGDQALLVAAYFGGGSAVTHVLVRQGDLLTEFVVKVGRARPILQRLGRTAAERLCDGGRAC
jgi:hypothetical protein